MECINRKQGAGSWCYQGFLKQSGSGYKVLTVPGAIEIPFIYKTACRKHSVLQMRSVCPGHSNFGKGDTAF